MGSSVRIITILALTTIISQANAQFADCVQNCINNNTSQSCRIADFPCICRQSSGNFLPNVITCMHDTCDNNLDSSVFLSLLSIICQLAGSQLPASAVSSALRAGSSLAAQPTTVTATVSQGPGASLNGGIVVPVSTTIIPGPYTTATLSGVTFTWGGPETSTIFGVSPISTPMLVSSTMSDSSPSSSGTTSSSGFVGLIPIVITTTNSAGSTYTSTTGRPGAVSTYTTTDSRGAIVVQTSTYTQSASSSASRTTSLSKGGSSASLRSGSSTMASGGVDSDSSRSSSHTSTTRMQTSTIFTPERTSAGGSSRTSTASGSGSTDSAPFTNTNGGSIVKNVKWLGMSVLTASLGFLV